MLFSGAFSLVWRSQSHIVKFSRCIANFFDPDPFVVRFRVDPEVTLDLEQAVPIYEEDVWERLSITRALERRVFGWAQHPNLRASLRQIPTQDGVFLRELLNEQRTARRVYPLTAQDQRRLKSKASVRTADRAVVVEVPDDDLVAGGTAPSEEAAPIPRKSIQLQATLARIGSEMGFRIWIPRSDRQKVSDLMPDAARSSLLELLPLNYDDATLKTVEQIDVIWLKNRSMARAFEVEHTTAIYSGLLRMADLLALQPNMAIRLHIVAPDERRERVLREIRRPVFSLLDQGPLYEKCTYISYSAIDELGETKHLTHMNETILDEYEESAED